MSEPDRFDASTKGVPSVAAPVHLEEIAERGWNVLREDVPLPCAVLKETALAANLKRMNRFLQRYDLRLCPHAKTTMSPQLIRRQLEAGAWGVTAATATHVAAYRKMGVSRVLLANQLVGRQSIRSIAELLNQDAAFEFYCLVDSVALVQHLSHWASQFLHPSTRLDVLLEIGMRNARTGARSLADALLVARAVAREHASLTLAGVECYEGVVPGEPDAAGEARIGELFGLMREVTFSCEREGLFPRERLVLSAGGSAYVDLAAEALASVQIDRATRVLRSGCYITHDNGWLHRHQARARERTVGMEELPAPQPALEVWAYVQSVHEPGHFIVTLGKRDVSYDIDLPIPRCWFRPGAHSVPQTLEGDHHVTRLNDQHAWLAGPAASSLRVGDMLAFGISHPCTTFDKWRLLYVVDSDYNVVEAITTCF